MKTFTQLQDLVAQKALNFVVKKVASPEYSKMLQVMVGLGIEQLGNRAPINYDSEYERLSARGFISDK